MLTGGPGEVMQSDAQGPLPELSSTRARGSTHLDNLKRLFIVTEPLC